MTLDEIRQLIELVQKSEIAELRITRGDDTIRITRQFPAQVVASPPQAASTVPNASPAAVAPVSAEQPAPAVPSGLHEITAPMVGTFYRAPSPESPPYINVGDHIDAGQTICIIEAMKLMNEIPADRSGTVTEIAVENAQPVEFGQPLIRIKPD